MSTFLTDDVPSARTDAGPVITLIPPPRSAHTEKLGRLEELLDPAGLRVLVPAGGSGMLAVSGFVDGVAVTAFATDPAVQGGALGIEGCDAVVAAYRHALAERTPVIGLWHSGGARLREGVESLDAVGKIFAVMTEASGRIPQISVVLGPAAGGAAYGPALTDIVILASEGQIFVTGPGVVRSVTGEQVSAADLGGPEPHARRSGVAHLTADSAADAIGHARRVTSLLGQPNLPGEPGLPGARDTDAVRDRPLGHHLPARERRAYDVRPLVHDLFDSPGTELQPRWAPNLVTALGRLGGRTIGILANNPLRRAGCLDSLSAEKGARFVRMCDAFGIPLVVVVDVPGYLPGVSQEWDGVVRRGAKLLHAFAEATTPRVTVITRKAYGGAFIAMNSRSLGASRVVAWPGARIAVMGSVAAVRVLHRRQLAAAPDADRERLENQLAAEHEAASGGLARALTSGVIDEVIEPDSTRTTLARILATAPRRRGRHTNIPL
jgi:acetyl-CoA/propionyl-CoA carboxylase carboxyl transferase subunit